MMRVGRNLLWAVYHIFSVPVLVKTLLSPWKRLSEEPRGNIITNFQGTTEAFIVNSLMRIVGVMVRFFILTIAAGLLAALAVAGAVLLALWVIFPALPIALLFAGFFALI
jgi:hypothetical protein